MKRLLLYGLFVLISSYVLAQKPLVCLEVEPKEAVVGEVLTITVKSNMQGELDIEFPTGYVHGYNVMSGMEQEMDYSTGKVITYYYVSQTGAMNKEGTFTIGPAYIKKGNKVYRSNTVSVTIKKETTLNNSSEITSKQLRQPAFGIIEKSRSSIYEGESVVLNSRIYSQFNPSHLENYQEYSVSGTIDKHEIGNNQRILVEETSIKNTRLYTFSYDRNVVFPGGTGKIEVEPFKLILRKGFESIPITSGSTFIDVKPLPAGPADFFGGVGEFQLTSSLSAMNIKQGDVIVLTLRFEGHGNLHNLKEPILQLPKGFIIYGDPVAKEEFSYGSKGAEGSVSFAYNIQVTREGQIKLPAITLSYFDPTKEKYVQLKTSEFLLNVELNKDFKVLPEHEQPEGNFIVTSNGLKFKADRGNIEPSSILQSPVLWIGIGSPFILALLLGFAVRRKEVLKPHLELRKQKEELSKEISELLKSAELQLQKQDTIAYSASLEKALEKSISWFLYAEQRVVSKTEMLDGLRGKGIHENRIETIEQLLNTFEYTRFGMSSTGDPSAISAVKELCKTFIDKC
jgi:hypothetical protein